VNIVTLILAAIAGYLAFWAGVVSLIGFMGWKPLAARYPAARWPDGEGMEVGWGSGSVAMSNYNGVVTAEGLYLRPIRAFAYNHPPVFIPWEAVEAVEGGTPRLFGGIALRLEGGKGVRLRGRLARAVQETYAVWDAAHAARKVLGGLDPEGENEADPHASAWRRTRTR
jgi:hypothetical protein